MLTGQSIKILSSLKVKEKVFIFSALAILTVYLPTIIHSQPVTGSLVNMSLVLAVFLIGPLEALLLGLMPSVFALASGLLPLPLTPMVPFIMAGNAILVVIYYYLGRKHFGLAIIAAAFGKFLFLYAIASLLINFLPHSKQMLAFVSMMGWAQFMTAVTGGVLAYLMLFFIKKIKDNQQAF